MENRNLHQNSHVLLIGFLSLVLGLIGCGEKPSSFSLLSDTNNFQQNAAESKGMIDILWVVDNSGSMESSQQAVADNFQRFIEKFSEKGFDYRIAVTTSDAYRTLFGAPQTHSRFRDGTDATQHTGVFLIDPTTLNMQQTFLYNIKQGIYGSGDERAFQSFKETLLNPLNAGFPRPGAFLSIIIVSDEDDFSHDAAISKGGQYSYAGLHKADDYVTFLDGLTSSTPEERRYSVNSIAILDEQCRNHLWQTSPDYVPGSPAPQKVGYRYMQLSEKTEGIKGSLCDDFATTLSDISSKIIELTTQFYLNRLPNPDTIAVSVNGVLVPKDSTNGYSYHADTNSIKFHGSHVPAPGSSIVVLFDPLTLK